MATTLLDRLTLYEIINNFQSYYDITVNVLAIVGALYASKVIISSSWTALSIFRQFILTRIWYEKDFSTRYGGNWAIITGASDGLGKAYAFELARRKMNVFLISRNKEKLEIVANEIKEKYAVETKCYSFDLVTLRVEKHYDEFESMLQSLDIGVLINNVGALTETLQNFVSINKATILNINELNMNVLTLMTNMVLPKLLLKKKGAIVNISSIVSLNPTPLMSVYSASKEYVDYLTESLWYECKDQGVSIHLINPGYISTQMVNYAKPDYLSIIAAPLQFADNSLRTLSVSRQSYGCLTHHLLALFGNMLSRRLWLSTAYFIHGPIWHFFTGRELETLKKEN